MDYLNNLEEEQRVLNQLQEEQHEIDFVVLLCLDIEQQLLKSLPTAIPPRVLPSSQCLEKRRDSNRSRQFSQKRERDAEQPLRRVKQRPTIAQASKDNSNATANPANFPSPRKPSSIFGDTLTVSLLVPSQTAMMGREHRLVNGASRPTTRARTPSESDNEKPTYPPRVNLFSDHYQPHSAYSRRPATPPKSDVDKPAYPTRVNLFPSRYQRYSATTTMAGASGNNHKSDIVERRQSWGG